MAERKSHIPSDSSEGSPCPKSARKGTDNKNKKSKKTTKKTKPQKKDVTKPVANSDSEQSMEEGAKSKKKKRRTSPVPTKSKREESTDSDQKRKSKQNLPLRKKEGTKPVANSDSEQSLDEGTKSKKKTRTSPIPKRKPKKAETTDSESEDSEERHKRKRKRKPKKTKKIISSSSSSPNSRAVTESESTDHDSVKEIPIKEDTEKPKHPTKVDKRKHSTASENDIVLRASANDMIDIDTDGGKNEDEYVPRQVTKAATRYPEYEPTPQGSVTVETIRQETSYMKPTVPDQKDTGDERNQIEKDVQILVEEKIARIRRRVMDIIPEFQSAMELFSDNQRSAPCLDYNRTSCKEAFQHRKDFQRPVAHICEICLRVLHLTNMHEGKNCKIDDILDKYVYRKKKAYEEKVSFRAYYDSKEESNRNAQKRGGRGGGGGGGSYRGRGHLRR